MHEEYENVRPTGETLVAVVQLKSLASTVREFVEAIAEPSRERSLALTNLDQAVMWGTKALCFDQRNEQQEG